MIGQIVNHRVFGKGKITMVQPYEKGIWLTISFSSGQKTVSYSSEHKHFLKFENVTKQQELDEILLKIEKEAQRRKQDEEKCAAVLSSSPTKTSSRGKKIVKGTISTIRANWKLVSGEAYGITAQGIYDACSDVFGWDRSLRGHFGKQKSLFAPNATLENYDVLFLAHSNWTCSKNGKVSNEISQDMKFITEHWEDITSPGFLNDCACRVVFAKNGTYYVFLGVYKYIGKDSATRTKKFELIYDHYERSAHPIFSKKQSVEAKIEDILNKLPF